MKQCERQLERLAYARSEGLSIGNGILTVENINQAKERSDPKKLNKVQVQP